MKRKPREKKEKVEADPMSYRANGIVRKWWEIHKTAMTPELLTNWYFKVADWDAKTEEDTQAQKRVLKEMAEIANVNNY